MQSNPHTMKSVKMKFFNSHTLLRKVLIGVLALALAGLAMRAATHDASASRSDSIFPAHLVALQSDQPQVGPGVPQVGSSAAKSALSNNKAGSVLFFHKYTSDAANPSNINTLVSLTNHNPRDGVTMRLYFVR